MTEESINTADTPTPPFNPADTQSLLDFFEKSATRPIKGDRIAEKLGIAKAQRADLNGALEALVADGKIVETRDKRYGLPERMNLVVGTLTCHEKGFGFVVPRHPGQADLYIPRHKLGDAMHGDVVIARREPRRGRKSEGRIIRLLHRARTQVVGTFERGRSFAHVVPLDVRVGYQVYVAEGDIGDAKPGQIVCAEITSYPEGHGRRNPEGRIVEVLGDADDPKIDVDVIIREYQLPYEFPAEVLAEAEEIPTEVGETDIEGRTDFRELPIVTIDGESAEDFDDAVYVQKLPNGNYSLAVHIADVGAYVAVGSAIDREAQRRATSVYFPDRVVPMLPERLSNEICSLKPGVDRLVQSVVIEINREGRTVNYEFHDGVIRSAERMTYRTVAAVLDGSDTELAEKYADHVDHFRLQGELCGVLRAYRGARGSIDFDLPEPELLINLRGEVEDVVRSERNFAHRIIEEFMIRANEVVASHLEWEDMQALFRVHDGPDLEKVEGFREFISGLGLSLGGGSRPRPSDFQKLVEHLEGQPGERVIIYLMLRTMKQARYQVDNVGHFGLASERYTHFTSPIRRYPDLAVHRILRVDRGSKAQPEFDFDAFQAQLSRIGSESSERERNAEDAERRYVSWKMAQFMADKVGDSFEAFVTGVHSYGFFIELDRFFVDGLVHVSSLSDDYYEYDERRHTLRGETKGRVITLGDKVRVQLVRVDPGRRRLDFSLEEGPLETGITLRVADETGKRTGDHRRSRRRRRGRTPVATKAPEAGSAEAVSVEAVAAAGGEKKADEGRPERSRRSRRGGSRRGGRRKKVAQGAEAAQESPRKADDGRRRTKKVAAGRSDQTAKSEERPANRRRRRGKRSGAQRAAAEAPQEARSTTQRSQPAKQTPDAGKEEAPQSPRVNPYLTDL